MLLQVAITAALCGQFPLSTQLELPSGDQVSVACDLYTGPLSGGTESTCTGNVELRTPKLLLRADEVRFDQEKHFAVASGDVTMVSGLFVAVADEVTVDLQSYDAHIKGGLFLQKKDVTAEQLLSANSAEELKKLGRTSITVTGTRIKRIDEDEFFVEGLSFTPCDCDPSQPSWRVEASRAEVEIGERAILTWPIVYVGKVPVFALPWLYLPLSERRSGLLVPRPSQTAQNGFQIEAPVFLTLGRSYDTTLTPGYYGGSRQPRPDGVKGPRLQGEFRYVPSDQTQGRLTLGVLYDLKDGIDPVSQQPLGTGRRGLRGESSWSHVQELGGGFYDRLDLSILSDGFLYRDLTTDIIGREAGYTRSTGTVYRRTETSYAGLELAIRQDVRNGFSVFETSRDAAGNVRPGAATIQKFPALVFHAPQGPVWGPLQGGLRMEVARFSPLTTLGGDEGCDGIFAAGLPESNESQMDRRFQGADSCPDGLPGEREARDRLEIHPRISGMLSAGRFLRVTPYASYRQAVYAGEVTGRTDHRGYPLGGAELSTELSRTYEEAGGVVRWRHAVTPEADLRYVPFVVQSREISPYDELDSAVPSRGLFQGVVALRQTLDRKENGGVQEAAKLDVGQGFDLRPLFDPVGQPRLADTWARLLLQRGPLSLGGTARYDLLQREITQISFGFSLNFPGGESLYGSYDDLLNVGSDRQRRTVDSLVGPALFEGLPPDTLPAHARQFSLGGRVNFKLGLSFRYEAIVQPFFEPVAREDIVYSPGVVKTITAGERLQVQFPQQVVGVGYGPACDCWRLEGQAIMRGFRPGQPLPALEFGVNLSISRFGSFGSGG